MADKERSHSIARCDSRRVYLRLSYFHCVTIDQQYCTIQQLLDQRQCPKASFQLKDLSTNKKIPVKYRTNNEYPLLTHSTLIYITDTLFLSDSLWPGRLTLTESNSSLVSRLANGLHYI